MARSERDIQDAHIADPASCASVTFTHSWNGSTDPTEAEGLALIADLGALKTAIDSNNEKIDKILVALEEAGIIANA